MRPPSASRGGAVVRLCYRRRVPVRFLYSNVLIGLLVAATGCSNSTSPSTTPSGSGNTPTRCSVIVGNKGSVTATVDGASFTGITPTGGAGRTQNTLTLFGTNTDDTTITLGTTAATGAVQIAAGLVSPASITLQTRSCTAGTGTWQATIAAGSGTITVSTLTATGATGTFSGTLVAVANTGAGANKTIVNGQFSVTF